MGKRLYHVVVELDMVVVAGSEDEAEEVARSHADRELGDNPHSASLDATVISHGDEIPRSWRGSIPYGDNPDGLTCMEIQSQGANP